MQMYPSTYKARKCHPNFQVQQGEKKKKEQNTVRNASTASSHLQCKGILM